MGNEQSAPSHARPAAMHPMMMVAAKSAALRAKKKSSESHSHSRSGSNGDRRSKELRHRSSMSSSSSSSGRLSMSSSTMSFDMSSRRSSADYQRKASNASMMSTSSRSSESLASRLPRAVREESALDVTLFEEDAGPVEKSRFSRLKPMPNRYDTIEQVQHDLRVAGLEASRLVVAIDYTKSNRWCGEKTFGGRSLHAIDAAGVSLNPYESAMLTIGRALEAFNPSPDAVIPAFGFGGAASSDGGCLPLFSSERGGCLSLREVVRLYREVTPTIKLSGSRDFAPVIRATIDIVRQQPSPQHHVLVIITSGVPANEEAARAAVVNAANWPISIVVVGVGDGPWDAFESAEVDGLAAQRPSSPNFQFVDFYSVTQRNGRGPEAGLAAEALAKLPDHAKVPQRFGVATAVY